MFSPLLTRCTGTDRSNRRTRVFGADMRVRGDRAHALGWKPRKVDMRDTIVADVKDALEAMGLQPKISV